MAGIRGVKLKNIEYEPGPHHGKITGEIYFDDRKIGELLDDGWIEEIYIEFINEDCKKDFDKKIGRYVKKNNLVNYSSEMFIKELVFEEKMKTMLKLSKKRDRKNRQISYL